jgi:DNA polymerase (family 10)
MAEKPKFDSDEAAPVAVQMLEILKPFCERIEIAGSLRRMKDRVGDIELLFIPRFEDRQMDMFTTEPMDLADEKINALLKDGTLLKRPNKDGIFTWGKKNKLCLHNASGIPIDLFSTTAENWFVSLVIRTGSKETNLALTNGAIALGGSLNAYGSGVSWKDGSKTIAESEEHVFRMCGVKYRNPNER